ncbi:MAG: DUF4450 domain-containing protein [Planctomycetaceae bacterium]|nr:DUF4450 domain-containing protein [Planctomycetaceae bacterium]
MALWGSVCAAYDPPERIMVVRPTFEGQTERPLRYQPQNRDFVIRNGKEVFNRPLYGGNTAFRIDAGDMPEFSLYLPGQVGKVQFGIETIQGFLLLHKAKDVTARYRPGSMVYEIRDPLLGSAALNLSVARMYDAEGFIARAELQNGGDEAKLVMVYGGCGGKKGKRGGDIGCESQPVSEFFQFRPENCSGNVFEINANTFILSSKTATMAGVLSSGAALAVADGSRWDNIKALTDSPNARAEYPVLMASVPMRSNEPVYAVIQRAGGSVQLPASEQLDAMWSQTEQRRTAVAERVTVDTPDPFIDAAAAALCVAADAIWDEPQGSVMHGAVAWRSKYLGWRGPYANDAVGRHDRSKRHLVYWAAQQNTKPFDPNLLGPDPASNLSRSHPAKQTSGDIGGKHYDMNLVYMDALIRHLLWTGDLKLAGQLWPVIERHMDWERRLFRRTFGPEQLPLYEAYAAIWASDDLEYSGGGVTHASAYNYYHNLMLARLAELLGKDGAAYQKEADLIRNGMQTHLWLADRGWYGEWKDLRGAQQVHPSAALWTFYHTIDSQAASPEEAWQMSRFVDTQIAHIPVHGGGIPRGKYYTLPTTNWMPYTWSTNNVVMAEVAHTSLAYWQCGRPDKAYELFKGCILDSMFMGACPGNAGMTTYFDMARGEAQRDFGDAVGTCWRAMVEGLFGIRPDLLNGVLEVRPGFPGEWDYASIKHPDFSFAFKRDGQTETYQIESRFAKPVSIALSIPALSSRIGSVTVNGKPTRWAAIEAVGKPLIRIQAEPAAHHKIVVEWQGSPIRRIAVPEVVNSGGELKIDVKTASIEAVTDPQKALQNVTTKPGSIQGKVNGLAGHRTVFATLKQDQMRWSQPLTFEVRPSYEVVPARAQAADSIAFRLRNNTSDMLNNEVTVTCGNYEMKCVLRADAFADSEEMVLRAVEFKLLPGSNAVTIRSKQAIIAEEIVTNWNIKAPDNTNWSAVELRPFFNDSVTQIFRNSYISPRSPYCSLAIPKQGIGSWCNFEKTFDVDDSGLRQAASEHGGKYELANGVVFITPAEREAANTMFVSQWDNYPREKTIELCGKACHIYLLMAGSTNSMQSRFDNGEVIVTYADGETERLALENPTTWWPIDQDYFCDDYGFKRPEAIPPRVHLKTGKAVIANAAAFRGKGGAIAGGAASVLDLPLKPDKELQCVTVRAIANEVVIGLMSVTLVR